MEAPIPEQELAQGQVTDWVGIRVNSSLPTQSFVAWGTTLQPHPVFFVPQPLHTKYHLWFVFLPALDGKFLGNILVFVATESGMVPSGKE